MAKWFIDELVKRYEAGNYNNLELYGIYMISESVDPIGESLCQQIAGHIHSKGLDFLWIPYFKAYGASDWKKWGFNIAYHQPNHFFKPELPDSRLDEAIDFARQHGMCLEFECDENLVSENTATAAQFRPRMVAYMDYFEKRGVWYDTPVAYYTGNHLLLDFVTHPNPMNVPIFDRLCRYVVNRRLAQQK